MAAVFVAFAEIGGIRTKSRAGKEMKLPPPATELIIPATSAAVKRKPASRRDTAKHNVPVFFCHSHLCERANTGTYFRLPSLKSDPRTDLCSEGNADCRPRPKEIA